MQNQRHWSHLRPSLTYSRQLSSPQEIVTPLEIITVTTREELEELFERNVDSEPDIIDALFTREPLDLPGHHQPAASKPRRPHGNSLPCSEMTREPGRAICRDYLRTQPAIDSSSRDDNHPRTRETKTMQTPRPNYFVHQITKATDLTAIAQAIIDAACHYADLATMKTSATLCISDARKMMNVGRYENAIGRATPSLAYSIG